MGTVVDIHTAHTYTTMPSITKVESKEQWETALKSEKPIVLYFTMFEHPQETVKQILDTMFKEFISFVGTDTSENQFLVIDLNEQEELAVELKCRAVSSFHGYVNGKLVSKTDQTDDIPDLVELMVDIKDPSAILPHKVKSQEEFDQILADNELVVVDFTAEWCGPCQMIGPKFKEMAKAQRDSGKNLLGEDKLVKFIKVEETETKDIIEKAGVSCYPSFYMYKNGEKVDSLQGADDEKLSLQIKKLINPNYVEVHFANFAETKADFDKILADNQKAVFVDFTASWCPPCKMIKPIYEELAETHKDLEGVKFVKIDVDENEEVSQEYAIRSMPTFKVFVAGKEVKEDGFGGADVEELKAMVAKYAK